MAVLQNIRVKFGVLISIIIALALLSFIIDPGTLESAINSMSSKYDVGNIDGKKISYTDFQADVDRYTTINEIMTGSSVRDEQANQQIRDAAWKGLIDKYLFIKNAKAAGISVGEAEILDLTTGNNVSPIISGNPAFSDENGSFSVDKLVSFIQQIESDNSGQLRTYWNYVQNAVYTQEYYSKYGALFTAGDFQNALQIKNAVSAGNTTADIDYVVIPYPMGKDSSINVTAAEVKSYYNSHKEFFKQGASRDMEYVVFEVVPSAKDIQGAEEAMEKAYAEFGTASNMKTFLLKNSERQLSEYWYKAGELSVVSDVLDKAVFSGEEMSPIVKEGNSFFAARVLDSKMIPDSVFVKHILVQSENPGDRADSLVKVLLKKGSSFSNLAAQYSVDQKSAAEGEMGSIGWMTQSYMIPGFESVLTAEVGKPYVINTQYGTHVVLVSKRTKPVAKKQVAILERTALASKETFNRYYSQANTFAGIASGTYDGYRRALDSLGIYSHMLTVTEATSSYGSIDQAKEITRWVFDNKAGKASNIITVNNNYFFVAAVKAVHKEGYTPLKEVSSRISERLYMDKVKEKTKAETASKIKGLASLEAVAEAFDAAVSSKTAVSFSLSGAGMVDPALLGAASVAQEGIVCGPVDGMTGLYVFKVSNRQEGSYYTEDDARTDAGQKTQYASQMIIPAMMQNADVKDNRARFF